MYFSVFSNKQLFPEKFNVRETKLICFYVFWITIQDLQLSYANTVVGTTCTCLVISYFNEQNRANLYQKNTATNNLE